MIDLYFWTTDNGYKARQMFVEYAEDVADHVFIVLLDLGEVFREAVMEQAELLGERRKSRGAVKEPLVDFGLPHWVFRVKHATRLDCQIFEDGPRFTQGYPLTARPIVVD